MPFSTSDFPDSFLRSRDRAMQDIQRPQMYQMHNQAMGGIGLGGLGQEMPNPFRELGITPASPPREKTVREELQSEINDWLKDV